uniref:Ig-like domain-containing protein n=1 Tax=Leptobrachium leishanense TaxID=445787 RepID=A0A8C5MBP9_9ANUR
MTYFIVSALISGEKVTQSPTEVTVDEGSYAAFFCTTDVTATNMFWYIQKAGHVPNLLVRDFTRENELDEEMKGRLSFKYDRTTRQFPLNITNVKMTDAGTYYCAMYPTLCTNGTKLNVLPNIPPTTEPSVYRLEPEEIVAGLPSSVCLATDFQSPNGTIEGHVTNEKKTQTLTLMLDSSSDHTWRYAAIFWDDSLNVDETCKVKYDKGNLISEGVKIHCNERINTVSLTVLGLRMLTAKAIVFNLIITLRLWSS